ncbi:MAG: GntR family transcriptional regulator, partial [Treponema sp.]|nr:GntR family transcriptional regulator [Treponema sp.]
RSMAALCKVSITPIIDALNRLETEGFVESTPYNSSKVVSLNEQRLADVYVLREAIEAQIVRMLCFTISLEEAKKLRELAVKIDSLAGNPDKSPDYDEMHYKFHIQLAQDSGSKNLVDQMESLHIFSLLAQSEMSYTSLDRDLLIQDYSHEDIINAILKRNPEEAERIVRNHVYRSRVIPPPYWI